MPISSDMPADVAVIGGGPAGMMAAIAAAGLGASVVLCEQLDRPGAKLLVTGGGRCNLTNMLDEAAFMSAFGREGRFMQPALAVMSSRQLRDFFHELGVPTEATDGVHVFPRCNSAAAVCGAMLTRCEALGVRVLCGIGVTGLLIEEKHITGLQTSAGRILAGRVIIATGGRGYPKLGATGGGYEFASAAGHAIRLPLPALVPLVTAETWPRRLAGISVEQVNVRLDLPGHGRKGVSGEVLFTHRGLSGPTVLDISGDVAEALHAASGKGVPIRVNFTPRTPARQWLARLDGWRSSHGRKLLRTLIGEHAPSALAQALCEQAGANEATAAHLTAGQAKRLVELMTDCLLTAAATEGWDKAMITRGGVSLKEVDPRTLASRLIAGLHFAGEVLDLDGPCGGFNLQWAFSSGWLAGLSAASTSKERA